MLDIIENVIDKNRLALITDSNSVTYNELQDKVSLYSKFFTKDQIVILICQNSLESIYIYLSALKQGSILLLLNERIDESFLNSYAERYKASVICSPFPLENNGPYQDLLEDYYIYYKYPILLKNKLALCLLLTTSGSTNNPKLVRITKENIISNTRSIIEYLDLDESDRHITTLPMNYTYGLSCINTFLFTGGSIVLNRYSVIERNFWNNVKLYKPNYFSGVPYTYEMLDKMGFDILKESSIETFTQAGGKLSDNLLSKFAEFSYKTQRKFIVMYGQTEATARMSYLPHEMLNEKMGSIGIAIPGGKFELGFTDKYPESNGSTVGELIYYGKNVSVGYAEEFSELDNPDLNQSMLNTGDLAWIDHQGFVFLVGRVNRFAKINGLRVSLTDIEQILEKYRFKVAVISDDILIRIYFARDSINQDEVKRIKDIIVEETSISRASCTVIPLDEIPRNESGKIQYYLLPQ